MRDISESRPLKKTISNKFYLGDRVAEKGLDNVLSEITDPDGNGILHAFFEVVEGKGEAHGEHEEPETVSEEVSGEPGDRRRLGNTEGGTEENPDREHGREGVHELLVRGFLAGGTSSSRASHERALFLDLGGGNDRDTASQPLTEGKRSSGRALSGPGGQGLARGRAQDECSLHLRFYSLERRERERYLANSDPNILQVEKLAV